MENNCKSCGSKLVIRETQKKPSQLKKNYYYTAYYFCTKCLKLYLSDKFKVINHQTLMFPPSIRPHPNPLPRSGRGQALRGEETNTFDAEIWTDGACVFNGQDNAKAAWSFVSGKTEKAGLIEGKQTNNVAEALAIYYALLWTVEQGYKKLKIYSDSQISINNMKKSTFAINKNREIFERIATVITENNLKVHFEKVIGHSGDINNERADRLANGLAGNK